MKKVLTYLKFGANSEPVLGQFGQCVVSSFLKNKPKSDSEDLEVEVHCDLAPQGLVLEHATENSSKSVLLRHPPFCPMFHLSPEQKENFVKTNHSGISVAVAVILESSDSKVMITRRPKHMRTFPNVWVPPGGSSEESETILDTGLREVHEETGLDVKPYMSKVEPLCLWESVYPPLLAKGDPKRHQMVVYLHVVLEKCVQDLIKETKLCPEETDAYAWLDLTEILIATDYSTNLDTTKNLSLFAELKPDGSLEQKPKSYDMLRAEVPFSGSLDVERISTGTRFALEQFYAKKIRVSKI